MADKQMTELSIAGIRNVYNGSCIGNDLIMIDEIADINFPDTPRRMQCILMGLCLRGNASYTMNADPYEVKTHDAIIIQKGTVVNNCTLSDDFSGIGIILSEKFFSEIVKGVHELSSLFIFSRSHPVFTLRDNETKDIINYFNAIKWKVDDTSHHFRTDVARSMIMTMIYDLSNVIYRIQQTENRVQTRAEDIFTRFINLVEKNFRSERRVGWYGEQLCISPKYLSETVKQVSNRTPNEWIDYYVILETRVLLKDSAMSIKEIAKTLNFPNQSFLGKFFKEHVGMSPSEYRKS